MKYVEKLHEWRKVCDAAAARAAAKNRETATLEEQRAEVVRRLVDATGEERETLAAHWHEISAAAALAAAEFTELQRQLEAARLKEPPRPRFIGEE